MPRFDRRRFLALTAAVSAGAMRPRSTRAVQPLRIGCLFNLTGPLKAVDEPAWEGAKTAAGSLGGAVELVVRDGRSDPAVIAAEAGRRSLGGRGDRVLRQRRGGGGDAGAGAPSALARQHGHPPASAFAAVGHDAVRLVVAAAAL
ncbi:MAG: hypothetical protein HQL41_06175, partial [Alphaproteobacteria bacterium]|nr:hypothetical protein [Alphaproteobacteria bacterium]